MRDLLLLAALGFGAYWLWKKKNCKSSNGDGDLPISLEDLRTGIANNWYSVKIYKAADGKFYAYITGKDNSGNDAETTRQITQDIYEALKADGVPEV